MHYPKVRSGAGLLLGLLAFFLSFVVKVVAQDGLIVSEVLAVNVSTLLDDFGESSDYVEIYNGSPSTVSLGGYYLSDSFANLTQWQFPNTNLVSGQSLLLWASGRDRRVAGLPLHTNFKLSSAGEQIVLTRPDGATVVHGFSFGPQIADRSFGVEVQTTATLPLVSIGAQATYQVPTAATLSNRWTAITFDDTSWTAGVTGFGFDTNPASLFAPFIKTDLRAAMLGTSIKRSGVYLRVPFVITNLTEVLNPTLSIRYDDGFVAYLNGREVKRQGLAASAVPAFNSVSSLSRSNNSAVLPEEFSTLSMIQALRVGTNILAIHAFNRAANDGDFLMVPELFARTVAYDTNSIRYFASPTPGAANATGYPGLSGEVTFSVDSTPYFSSFDLLLSARDASPLSEIRYTLNGTQPDSNSFLYTLPISITNSTLVRARLFEPGFLPGPVRGEGFVRMDPKMRTVSSDVPLLLFHSFGSGSFDSNIKKPVMIFVHEPYRGRSSFTNAPTMVFRAGAKLRGSSTAGNAKYNWAVDSWNEEDRGIDIPLLGMPHGSEWVFHGPFQFDPSLIHNPFASEMSNGVGLYASRFRFAEIYLNERASNNNLATVTPANYFGFYNILERIGVSPSRVDIDPLTDGDTQLPEISGGYLMSIDREFAGSPAFNAGGISINYIEPKYEDISTPARTPQRQYLSKYLNDFGAALASRGYTNPVTGYLPFINRSSWIDFHIINEISLNVDALRLSTYFYKPRNGPITFGPIWDFDRAFGSTDGRDDNPLAWDSGTGFFTYPWWNRVFSDPNFWQAYIDRFQELREGPFSDKSLVALIDRLNDQVKESAVRDLAKWQQSKRGGNQASEIAYFKNWLQRHLRFMDSELLSKPVILAVSGTVEPGTTVTITGPTGATLYYTTDGTDPRALHGGIASGAQIYTTPIPIQSETRLVVRSRDLTHKNRTGGDAPPISSPWSGPSSARFTLDPLPMAGDLVLTEINYHPAPPSSAELVSNPSITADDFEFVEIRNVSSHTLDLFGCRFTQGIDFIFGPDSTYRLLPGESRILARNLAGIQLRYGGSVAVAGVYLGRLKDSGDNLVLKDSVGRTLIDVSYQDSWYPTTDGLSYTLVANPLVTGSEEKSAWQPGLSRHGTPGTGEPSIPLLPRVVINEVVANSDGQVRDSIELLNLDSRVADISGWFLTDDPKVPAKYRIPDGTQLAPGGFLVVDEIQFNAAGQGTNGFQLSSRGDEAWLFAADKTGQLLGYSHGFAFGATESNTSLGRYVTTTGAEHWVAQLSLSLGATNSGPRVGPLVVREIFYHPSDVLANGRFWDDTESEFVELQNISAVPLNLHDSASGASWHLRGTVDFNFGNRTTLAPDERLLLVSFDPSNDPDALARFKARFAIPPGLQVVGPFQGHLANSRGVVRLSKPGPVDPDSGDIAYVTVDEVDYLDQFPWPAAADGAGASLERRNPRSYGNDPANWFTPLPSPGTNPPIPLEPTIVRQPVSHTAVGGTRTSFSVEVSTAGRVGYQWTFNGSYLLGATNQELTLDPVRIGDQGNYRVIVMSETGSLESAAALLTVLPPATIVRQPEGGTVKPGATFTLGVLASGKGSLAYQWFYRSFEIPGATNASLALTDAKLEDSGPYQVRVTDSIGSSTSDPAVVQVLVRPTFVSQPQSIIAVEGDDVEIAAEVSGLPPFGYRWRKANTTITGATNSVLRLTNVQASSAALYSVTVTNPATSSAGTNSQSATLIVMIDADRDHVGDAWEREHGYSPSDPTDASLDDDGDGQTTLQEFLAGTDPRDRNSVLRIDRILRGTNGTQLEFVARTNRGYSVQFRELPDRGGWQNLIQLTARTNEVRASVLDPLIDGRYRLYRLSTPQRFPIANLAPTLLQNPVDQVVELNETVVLEVQADGDGRLSYQWFKDEKPLPGATDARLEIEHAAVTDEGSYQVLVTDYSGSIQSPAAKLSVLQRPVFLTQPAGRTAVVGATILLSASASGSGPLTYQWLHNDQVIPGATNPDLRIGPLTPNDAGRYRVIVTAATSHGELRRSSATAQVQVAE